MSHTNSAVLETLNCNSHIRFLEGLLRECTVGIQRPDSLIPGLRAMTGLSTLECQIFTDQRSVKTPQEEHRFHKSPN